MSVPSATILVSKGMIKLMFKLGREIYTTGTEGPEALTQDLFNNVKLGNGQSKPIIIEPRHEISNNVVCATSKASY